ncbi:3'-5' exonuclease domain [Dillenia turbinata]|uniref:3'-5' exonuclease domain n=1 Tax=Dillenia turbinata TaxID=194707 RepID=A0AAN8VZS1_9MAGN
MSTTTQVITLEDDAMKAYVTSQASTVDNCIRGFLSNLYNGKKLIGLDTERTLIDSNDPKKGSKIAILQLCDGDDCLIIQLPYLDSMPTSLLNFLRFADYTFIGLGIRENVAELEKEYGVGVRNVVEVGELAASVKRDKSLVTCGLEELGEKVDKLRYCRVSSVVFDDWGAEKLTPKQVKYATLNAYTYFRLGIKLLRGEFSWRLG